MQRITLVTVGIALTSACSQPGTSSNDASSDDALITPVSDAPGDVGSPHDTGSADVVHTSDAGMGTDVAGTADANAEASTHDAAPYDANPGPGCGAASVTPGTWRNITPSQIEPSMNACTDIAYDPSNHCNLYAAFGGAGVWKSTDAGSTWAEIDNLPSPSSLGRVRIDPNDPTHLYTTGSVTGNSYGFWVSHDGGHTWNVPAAFTAGIGTTWDRDVYNIAVDPTDFNHLLLTFHYPWPNSPSNIEQSGIVESTDGGNTYIVHQPVTGMTTASGIAFLYNPALGIGDANTWLNDGGEYGSGLYRTTDGGSTWTQVSTAQTDHGGFDAHYSSQGYLYVGMMDGVYRSTDNGATWESESPAQLATWTYGVISDGHQLYSSPGFVGQASSTPFYVSPEGGPNEGTTWTAFNSQIIPEGPFRMTFDPSSHVIYDAAWGGGAWALTTQ